MPIGCNLVIAKGRLAPLRANVSLPRLELTAATLAVDHDIFLKSNLQLDIENFYWTDFWTDSTVVLYYIFNTTKRFSPFVGNRLTGMHLHTLINPADLPSRGCTPRELHSSRLWKHGPDHLMLTEDKWPPRMPGEKVDMSLVEFKKEAKSKREPLEVVAVTLLSLSSSWYVLCRRIAIWRKAFEWHLSNKKKVSKVKEANVIVTKLRLCRYIQKVLLLSDEKRARYIKLFPVKVKSYQLIRVGGRLFKSPLAFDTKHPIVLLDHALVRTLVRDAHWIVSMLV